MCSTQFTSKAKYTILYTVNPVEPLVLTECIHFLPNLEFNHDLINGLAPPSALSPVNLLSLNLICNLLVNYFSFFMLIIFIALTPL